MLGSSGYDFKQTTAQLLKVLEIRTVLQLSRGFIRNGDKDRFCIMAEKNFISVSEILH